MDMNNSRPVGTLDVSFYTGLICATLKDVAITCNQSDTELARDQREIVMRARSEGITFLTRTLPSLGKAFDRALSSSTCFEFKGFKTARGLKVPRFMRDIFLQVFDVDGCERSDASALAIKSLRQVFYLFYKLNLPPTEKQCNEVIELFIKTDNDLGFNPQVVTPYEREVLRIARNLICRVLAPVDPLDEDGFRPRHGPGAVATGEKANEKPVFRRYYRKLAEVFPYDRYFFFNLTHLSDALDSLDAMEDLETGTAKVVLVPKDSRGPRLISCEPLEYQWIQQGLMALMVKTIESHPLTAGYVNFTSQEVNQRLALESSLSGMLATLDMKEASDRVSLALVKALFPDTWFRALDACRTTSTKLPDGTILPLAKFAPMGSAVCFPVEALVFWALSVAALTYYLDSPSERRRVRKSIYVYGDDIICNIEDQDILRRKLPLFDLLFNEDKCCTGRFFRESCGVDAYKGVDVTPLKVRSVWSSSLAGTDYASWCAYHNAFERRGLFNACDYVAEAIQRIRLTPYADSEETSIIVLVDSRKMAVQHNKDNKVPMRFSRKHHYALVHGWAVHPRVINDTTVPGWSEVLYRASTSGEALMSPQQSRYETAMFHARQLAHLEPELYSYDLQGFVESIPGERLKAYQYTLPRQVSLRRGWGRFIIGRR